MKIFGGTPNYFNRYEDRGIVRIDGTRALFINFFRIYDVARVIQMNMEISLISAHIVLLYPGDPTYIEVIFAFKLLNSF